MNDLGDRLSELRETMGLTHAEMAKRFGSRPVDWKSVESGVGRLQMKTLVALAEAGFSIDWLFTGEGHMRRASAGATS